MDTDRNLLFGVLALQADLLSPAQFAEACSAWAGRKDTPLADLLVERGLLDPSDRADVDKLLQRKLAKHHGDARAGLAEVTTDQIRQSLAGLDDPDIRHTLTPPAAAHVLTHTTDYLPEVRDRYTLSRLHATGGIGRVWLAHDSSLGRDVALKELRPERAGQPAVWGRFLREAQVTGQLEHPGIVPVYELGRRPEDTSPFYTMRFVRGRTLAEAARAYHQRRQRDKAGPLELRELLTALVGVCNAVAYAHSRGVLHRDLKPHNVVLGDYGEVIVLDWGLAKVVGRPDPESEFASVALEEESVREATVQGQILGTPAYMPPEQAEGRLDRIDARSDVYGLGAILYEILTSQPPFVGDNTRSVIDRVAHDEPVPPRQAVRSTPAALEAVCLKALAKKPEQRYGGALELAHEVEHWLADEPVQAYPEPWSLRAGRWVRRNRTLVAAAAVLLVAAVVSSVIIAVTSEAARQRTKQEWLRAEKEQQLAEREQQRAEKNLDDGLRAVREHYVALSDVKQEDDSDPREVRRQQLQSARDYFQRVLEQRSDDPRVGKDIAEAHFRLGVIAREFGSAIDALASFDRARTAFAALARDYPQEPAYRTELSRCYNEIARVRLDQGKYDLTLEAFEESLNLREVVFRELPKDVLAGVHLASAHNNVALTKVAMGNLTAAQEDYEQAARLQEQLHKDHPKDDRVQDDLARTYHNLGRMYSDARDYPRALPLCQKALALQEALVEEHPGQGLYRYGLAITHFSIAWIYQQTGKEATALESYDKARKLQERLAWTNPGVFQYRRELANILNNMGVLYTARKDYRAARNILEQSIVNLEELSQSRPELASFRSRLAACCTSLAQVQDKTREYEAAVASYRKALALQEKLVEDQPKVVNYRYDLAMTYNNLGYLVYVMGSRDEALQLFRKAGEQDRLLLVDHPDNADYLAHLANTIGNIGDAERQVGNLDEAERAYLQRLALSSQASRSRPDFLECTAGVGGAYIDLGRVALRRRQWNVALDWLQRGEDTLSDVVHKEPWNTRLKYILRVAYQTKAQALTAAGQHRLAALYWGRASAQETGNLAKLFRIQQTLSLAHVDGDHEPAFLQITALAEANEMDGPTLYDLACFCSLAAGVERPHPEIADRYVRRTMALLRKAREVGYFAMAGKLANMKRDTDLDPMRQQPEFRAFLHELLGAEAAAKTAKGG
jgi:serine/threonine-protein kinase